MWNSRVSATRKAFIERVQHVHTELPSLPSSDFNNLRSKRNDIGFKDPLAIAAAQKLSELPRKTEFRCPDGSRGKIMEIDLKTGLCEVRNRRGQDNVFRADTLEAIPKKK